jgi:pimeloyl-ACP methyl ester carboxylesterase
VAQSRRGVIIIAVLLLALLMGVLGYFSLRQLPRMVQPHYAPPQAALALVSTRGQFSGGALLPPYGPTDYSVRGTLPGWAAGTPAPADLLVIIHGFNNNENKALYKFDVAREGLIDAGYGGAIAGFSWDADTQHDALSATGFHEGRRHAVGNGPKLARFVADYRARCPRTRIHLLGYSMGARVALETLWAADDDPLLAGAGWHVDSVLLVGAAVDNEEVELGERYGEAIERRAGALMNYFSPRDSKLREFFPFKEGDRALGQAGIEHSERAPKNYRERDVEDQLMSYDDSGRPEPGETGENHSGYLGNRGPDGQLLDDGVMDLVAAYLAGMDSEMGAD